jgi:hypothetical protein
MHWAVGSRDVACSDLSQHVVEVLIVVLLALLLLLRHSAQK